MLTVTEKKLTDSRKRAKILADNGKSDHPIETLFFAYLYGEHLSPSILYSYVTILTCILVFFFSPRETFVCMLCCFFLFLFAARISLLLLLLLLVNHEECDDVTFSWRKILFRTLRRLVGKNPSEITNLFLYTPNKRTPWSDWVNISPIK